jgi:hypothetical protein
MTALLLLLLLAVGVAMIWQKIGSEGEATRKSMETLAAAAEEAEARRAVAVLEQLTFAGDYLFKLTHLADEPDAAKQLRQSLRELEKPRDGPTFKELPPQADSFLGRWIVARGVSIEEWVNLPVEHPLREAASNALVNFVVSHAPPGARQQETANRLTDPR